ncbi:MAG: hypothetical protein NTX72_04020 [Candidatus Uhrbacteria bacterium]|nr:hypothetical protein [Candidatus Uhrbacteria bacterium]
MPQTIPYIGVTGFMNQEEVRAALAALSGTKHELMVGVLASAKTLRGETNSWPNRFPNVQEIAGIFSEDPRTLNLIHFATDDRNTIDVQLADMIELGGANLDGFQLNMVWPDPQLLRTAFFGHRLRVVLQVGTNAYKQVNNDPQKLAERLDAYKEIVTDILFDLSGGLGRELDADAGLPVLRAVHRRHPSLGLGIAGGLCAETLQLIKPIRREFPNVNFDAEGRIRDDKDARLNMNKTTAYLKAAVR